MSFDKNKPYGEVFGYVEGAPGARYTQDGVLYKKDGSPAREVVIAPKPAVVAPAAEAVVQDESYDAYSALEAEIDENGNVDNVSLNSVHWKTLKKMVEDKGGTYTSKSAAIEFLSV